MNVDRIVMETDTDSLESVSKSVVLLKMHIKELESQLDYTKSICKSLEETLWDLMESHEVSGLEIGGYKLKRYIRNRFACNLEHFEQMKEWARERKLETELIVERPNQRAVSNLAKELQANNQELPNWISSYVDKVISVRKSSSSK